MMFVKYCCLAPVVAVHASRLVKHSILWYLPGDVVWPSSCCKQHSTDNTRFIVALLLLLLLLLLLMADSENINHTLTVCLGPLDRSATFRGTLSGPVRAANNTAQTAQGVLWHLLLCFHGMVLAYGDADSNSYGVYGTTSPQHTYPRSLLQCLGQLLTRKACGPLLFEALAPS
jgi:hypothetical protein